MVTCLDIKFHAKVIELCIVRKYLAYSLVSTCVELSNCEMSE